MSIGSLTRTITEPFTYTNGQNLVGQSVGLQSWEATYNGLPSFVISSGTAQSSTTLTVGSVLRSASLPDKWANGFQITFDLKTDSLTLGHNYFKIILGAYAAPGTQYIGVYFNAANISTSNFDILDNIHIDNPGAAGGSRQLVTTLIPFTQNVIHQVVVTFVPNSLTTVEGVLTVTIDGVLVSTNAVNLLNVTDGVFLLEATPTTVSRWTIDNLVISNTYPAGRATASGVAIFPQGLGGPNRVLGYRTYNAPSTLIPTNHTALFDLGTLADNLTIANPADDGTGFAEAQRLEVIFKTSSDGSKTLSFGTAYKFGAGNTAASALSTIVAIASKNVRVLFEYDSVLAAFVCTRQVYGH